MPHELLADVRRVSGRAAVEDNDHGVVELLVEVCDDYSYFRRQVVSFFQNSDFASLYRHTKREDLSASLEVCLNLNLTKPTLLVANKVKNAVLNMCKDLTKLEKSIGKRKTGAFGALLSG